MRGIYSTIGMHVSCKLAIDRFANSPLTLPACAAAQVPGAFLDGEEWARSTLFSTAHFGIFDNLFGLVDVGNPSGGCVARARLPSL